MNKNIIISVIISNCVFYSIILCKCLKVFRSVCQFLKVFVWVFVRKSVRACMSLCKCVCRCHCVCVNVCEYVIVCHYVRHCMCVHSVCISLSGCIFKNNFDCMLLWVRDARVLVWMSIACWQDLIVDFFELLFFWTEFHHWEQSATMRSLDVRFGFSRYVTFV